MEVFGFRTARLALACLVCLLLALPVAAHAAPRRTPAPAPAPAPVAPGSLSVTAGDMVDSLVWSVPRMSVIHGYRVERAASPSGPWTVVLSRVERSSATVRVKTPGTAYYRIRTLDRRGQVSAPGVAVANTSLSMTRVVGSSGATLRASNGALALVFAPGTFSGSTRITITDAASSTPQDLVRVTGAFDFRATSALLKPATVTVPYRVPVRHFQVANTVAKAIDWMCLDPATGKWVPVDTTIDTTAGTLTAQMPHFSHWTAAFAYPHGTSPAKTDYCGTVCHSLAAAPGSPIVIANNDSQVCFNCHGNPNPAQGPLESVGRNIQADLYMCSGQSLPAGASKHPVRAPGATTGLTCVTCHDPHKDPTVSPKLLRAYDAITGRAIGSANATMPGSAFCWACHGVRKNVAADAAVPNYWTRTGNKKTKFAGTPHASASTADGAGCAACHGGHASGRDSLVRGNLNGVTLGAEPDDPCWACHESSAALPGEAAYRISRHAVATASTRALTSYPGATPTASSCGKCHAIHGTGNANYVYATGSTACVTCHDAATKDRTGYGYQGATKLAATSHGAYGVSTVRLEQRADFEAGVSSGAVPAAEGGLKLTASTNVALNQPYTVHMPAPNPPVTPVAGNRPMTNGTTAGTYASIYGVMDASVIGTGTVDIDLGTARPINGVKVSSAGTSGDPNRVEILTSMDGTSFTAAAAVGTVGVVAPSYWSPRLDFSARTARFVRVVLIRKWVAPWPGTPGSWGEHKIAEVEVYDAGLSGSWTSPPYSLSVAGATAVSGGITFGESEPGGSTVTLESSVSTISASTWSAWQPVSTNLIDQLGAGTPISSARVRFRATISRPDTVVDPRLSTITLSMGYSGGSLAAALWPAGPAARGECLNCHDQHAGNGLKAASATATCQVCHDHSSVVRPTGYGYRGSGAYAASAHSAKACASCHAVHGAESGTASDLLSADQEVVCFGCHSNPANSRRGVNVQERLSRGGFKAHDMDRAGQDATGSKLECDDCHQPHQASGAVALIDPDAKWTPFTATMIEVPGSSTAFDSITFCQRCHDGTLPAGVAAGTHPDLDGNIAIASYAAWEHGGAVGAPGESASDVGASLRVPYSYNMAPMPCTTCHDPHGSSNVYHLREYINGQGPFTLPTATTPVLRQWCGACHVLPTNATHTTCTNNWCHDDRHGG